MLRRSSSLMRWCLCWLVHYTMMTEMQFNNFIPLFMFPLHETEIWFHKLYLLLLGRPKLDSGADRQTGWHGGVLSGVVFNCLIVLFPTFLSDFVVFLLPIPWLIASLKGKEWGSRKEKASNGDIITVCGRIDQLRLWQGQGDMNEWTHLMVINLLMACQYWRSVSSMRKKKGEENYIVVFPGLPQGLNFCIVSVYRWVFSSALFPAASNERCSGDALINRFLLCSQRFFFSFSELDKTRISMKPMTVEEEQRSCRDLSSIIIQQWPVVPLSNGGPNL